MTKPRHLFFKVPVARLAAPLLLASLWLAVTAKAPAQTSPAHGPLATAPDMPMADYLGLLRQIAPAAEQGAREYLAAVRLRCGRILATGELRQALGGGGGDPQLLALIRASQLRDAGARRQAIDQIRCPQGLAP